jgi:pyruvate/2-oxoglutarate dehydrogenase complex dihydrolipoamide dehydrogenase (E3) component
MSATPSGFDYDVAVIGGGSGGYAAARTAASAGLKTILLEGGDEVGSLRILRGYRPTQALLYAAEILYLAGHSQPWGIRAGNVGFDFGQVVARKNATINDFAEDHRLSRRSGTGAEPRLAAGTYRSNPGGMGHSCPQRRAGQHQSGQECPRCG